MRFTFFKRRPAHNSHLFTAQYTDPKALFAYYFDRLPSIIYITEVDVNAAYAFIRQQMSADQIDCYQHSQYNYDTGRPEFNVTFIVLEGARLIEIGTDYVAVLHEAAAPTGALPCCGRSPSTGLQIPPEPRSASPLGRS